MTISKPEAEELVSSGETAVHWLYAISHQEYFRGDRAYLREIAEKLKVSLEAVKKRRRE